MDRFLWLVLVAITAILGYLMESVWLLVAAGIFFGLALLVLVSLAARRRARRSEAKPHPPAVRNASREDELRSLGLSEVRPKEGARPAEPKPPPPHREPAPEDESGTGAAATPETEPLAEEAEEPVSPAEPVPVLQAADEHPFWQIHSPTAVGSFLRALWAAAEVQTALIVAAEPDGTYTLLATRSHLPAARREGRFGSDSFLHVAQPERALTVLTDGDPLTRALPYYRAEAMVSEVAILPVHNHHGEPLFLVADLPGDVPAFTERQRILLLGFAELLETMLTHPPEDAPARALPTRRSIVAEEMAKARSQERPLALALVYRTDAEALATRSEAVVAEAERELRLFIEDLTAQGRIERFGEMMFGVFLPQTRSNVEAWCSRLRERAQRDGLPLAVGAALLGDHPDPDHLRADAVNALHEAVQTGEPVVAPPPGDA